MRGKYKVAIIGASGLVGRTVLKVLEEKNFPNVIYTLFSSKNSAGKTISFMGEEYSFCELTPKSFDYPFDYAIFCAGSKVAKEYAPLAVSKGCIVIDNSSQFRMEKNVPLVIPEVNPEELKNHQGIIANPNCSTIQALLPLKVLDDLYHIKRIVYSTYQAVSGSGRLGIEDLEAKAYGNSLQKFSYPIYGNCLPQIDVFLSDGYTKEEHKMIKETRKILKRPDLPITATCVRVPVINCHCETINVELEKDFDLYDVRISLQNAPGILVVDNPEKNQYPIPSKVCGNDEVFVGRIRKDPSVNYGLNLWVVADNLRKGAATNAVQILEKCLYSPNS